MKYKRIGTDSFRVIPVIPLEKVIEEENKNPYKQIINEMVRMNTTFFNWGAGLTKIVGNESFYSDLPHFSYKLYRKNGKIHQYVTLPKDPEKETKLLQPRLKQALESDIKSCRMIQENMQLSHENLHAYAVQGSPQLVIELDQEFGHRIKSLFRSIGKDQLLYSLTVKEVEDHEKKRDELTKRLAGIDPDNKKALLWNTAKKLTLSGAKALYDFWAEDETKEKNQQIVDNFKRKGWIGKEKHPISKRKLAQGNRYLMVEVMFLLWTKDQEKAQRFQSELQRLMSEMQGENQLQVIEIKPDLSRVAKGHLQYEDIPQLCLYKLELSKFLYLPNVDEIDDSFYCERPMKTEIPKEMYKNQLGAISFARDINSHDVIVQPKPKNTEDQDDYSTPVIVPGQMGAGKTVQLSNQVVETFCLGAENKEEWKKNARSAVVFDVADGEMISSILNVVPDWLKDRVIVLNHFDTENPIPVNSHDLLKLNREHNNEGAEFDIAQMETELLLDSMEDASSTISIERYYQNALQASYTLGKGTMLDAMRILIDDSYRGQMIADLKGKDDILRFNLMKDDMALKKDEKGVTLATIDNHLSQVQNNKPWLDAISQESHSDIDFWKWMNGDEDGAYLVLIYIPEKVGKHLRRFLFAHYFLKIWKLMKLREVIPKAKRKECLVIVDEIHQIIEQRAIQRIFGDIFKEPRKYRVRYFLTFHGWSSLEKGGRRKNEIIQSMKDSGCNLIMLKGGKDTFDSVASMLEPYNTADFQGLMSMEYSAIFKIAHGKKSNVFIAKMIEPPDKRLATHRKANLIKYKNKYGRLKIKVRQAINEELGILFEVIKAKEEARQEKQEKKMKKGKQMTEMTIEI
jgi:hypothetical protein